MWMPSEGFKFMSRWFGPQILVSATHTNRPTTLSLLNQAPHQKPTMAQVVNLTSEPIKPKEINPSPAMMN